MDFLNKFRRLLSHGGKNKHMKKYYSYNRKKSGDIRKVKRIILFVTSAVIVMFISALAAERIYKVTQDVDASEIEQQNESKEYLSLENDPFADDVAFVEKYLYQQYQGIIPDGADGRKIAYLTFDDGPSDTITPMILDTLKKENVKATFFVLGQALDKNDANKELLKRQVAEGHAIGNHTYSHNYEYLYPKGVVNVDNFMADVEKNNTLFKSILGDNFHTRNIRLPGGHMSWKGMKALDDILSDRDYHQVDWNTLPKDSEGQRKTASELVQELIKTVSGREKAIILMHDNYGKEETAKALPEIIKYLKEQGYEFRTMK